MHKIREDPAAHRPEQEPVRAVPGGNEYVGATRKRPEHREIVVAHGPHGATRNTTYLMIAQIR